MEHIRFNEGELVKPGTDGERFSYPVSCAEHETLLFKRRPLWQAYQPAELPNFSPGVIPDNVARAFVVEGGEKTEFADHAVSADMFGLEWEYIAAVGGSMVRPGKPYLSDISEWYDKIIFPDIEKWDWAGSAAKNNDTFLASKKHVQLWFQNGFFERLISLLDFENAAVSLLDDESAEHVHKFFDRLTALYIQIFDRAIDTYKAPDGASYIKSVFFHDDWGSQQAPFFSPPVCETMIVPYMKRLTDHLKSRGVFCELHSCGNLIMQTPNMIKAGWDAWSPQLMNDSYRIYDDFGDKILIGVFPQNIPGPLELKDASENKLRRLGAEFAKRVCSPEKPSYCGFYSENYINAFPAFWEGMYKQSRLIYEARK